MTSIMELTRGETRTYTSKHETYRGGQTSDPNAWVHICGGHPLFLWIEVRQCSKCFCKRDRMLRAPIEYDEDYDEYS